MNVSAPASSAIMSTQRPTASQQSEQKADMQGTHAEPERGANAERPPAPVVNTQGQTTGRLLNVVA